MGLPYTGSLVLQPIADRFGIEVYQLNFMVLEVLALILGCLLRKALQASTENALKRHLFNLTMGLALGLFCYGSQLIHIGLQSFGSYLIMALLPRKQSPLNIPTLLEFTSYMFNFQGIIVGPLVFYNDYIEFIDGTNIKKHQPENRKINSTPNPLRPMLEKLASSAFMGYIFFIYGDIFPLNHNMSQAVYNSSIFYRVFYLYASLLMRRVKYYFAWVLADAVNNASGIGFNGYDENGNEKWDLVTNVKIIKLETSTSFKTFLDNWNIQTTLWLRRMAYDRLPKGKTLAVFILSAFWHGFYPGYYLCFVLGAFITYAGRGIRRKIRPLFYKHQMTIYMYAVISWACTLFAISYVAGPYELRSLDEGIAFFNSWYWSINIITIALIFVLPVSSSTNKKKRDT